jgi:hypothetical protein
MRRRFLIGLALLAVACGGPPSWAVDANKAIALGIAELDVQTAGGYAEAAEAARESTSSWPEYDAAMRPWNAMLDALRISAASSYALDTAFVAWEQGGQQRWLNLGACLVMSLGELLPAAEVLSLRVPESMRPLVNQVRQAVGVVCNQGGE